MNSSAAGFFFSCLYITASIGIVLFMRVIRLSKKNAVKHGLYLILMSFIIGILMMGWIIKSI